MSNIKVGSIVVDAKGRRGVVTEVREDWDGFFACPEGMKYIEKMSIPGVGEAATITATAWDPLGDGSYKGLWADARLEEWTTVRPIDGN